jgi:hypothetical protein
MNGAADGVMNGTADGVMNGTADGYLYDVQPKYSGYLSQQDIGNAEHHDFQSQSSLSVLFKRLCFSCEKATSRPRGLEHEPTPTQLPSKIVPCASLAQAAVPTHDALPILVKPVVK